LPPAERRVVLKMLETFVDFLGCGRDGGHPPPPAQIRTCRITAYGSCLRYVTHRSAPLDRDASCGRSE
jgi:hypothetical protein